MNVCLQVPAAPLQHYFYLLPKSRNKVTILIQKSHNWNMLLLWCGLRHLNNTPPVAPPEKLFLLAAQIKKYNEHP
jgi:hypothetical protein